MHFEIIIKNKNHKWRSINFPDRYPTYDAAVNAKDSEGMNLREFIKFSEGRVDFEIREVK